MSYNEQAEKLCAAADAYMAALGGSDPSAITEAEGELREQATRFAQPPRMEITQRFARVGRHNPRLIYLDPVDKPADERGGGPENMVAVVVGPTPAQAVELAAWIVNAINVRLDTAW